MKMTSCCRAVDAFVSAASVISSKNSPDAKYERLFDALFSVLPCDAAVLLAMDKEHLVPVAVKGFGSDLLGRRFHPEEHPRLRAILNAESPLVFQPDSVISNPFESVTTTSRAEMGVAIRFDEDTVGALIIYVDSAEVIRGIDARELLLFATLAAANLRMVDLVDSLDMLAKKNGLTSKNHVTEANFRSRGELLGKSLPMQELRQEIQIVAASDLTVLITGETGTGKELAARSVHVQSSRSDKPLIYVNCAALPESIVESELFGHMKGAYTGADQTRAGKFELADGGTLFLDEIGELPLSVQPKLLRVIQSGEIQRLGADKNVQADVRIIAATNRDLKKEVELGHFRIDLYHRISVYPIGVPPLRVRGEDIALLAGYFMDQACVRFGLGSVRLDASAIERLLRYDWPGNVRELDHAITRSVLRAARGRYGEIVTIDASYLDLEDESLMAKRYFEESSELIEEPRISLKESVLLHKRKVITEAVGRASGNWAEAARRLNLHRSNLYRTARQVGLKVSTDNT